MRKKNYRIGEFAKLANVTERTLRYYDKINLLKPSFVSDNTYRYYKEDDLFILQKILFFKSLGFSLEEIRPLLFDEKNPCELIKSMSLQLDLINDRIEYYQKMKSHLKTMIRMLQNQNYSYNNMLEIINLITRQDLIVDQYRNAKNLNVRIQLHEQFSINKINWFSWVFSKIEFNRINRLLEIGCGNGELWKRNTVDLRNREVFLSDISEGMLEEAKRNLTDEYSFMCFNCEQTPFKKNFFDAVIGCHVLFYVNNIDKCLEEIVRILKNDGVLYATTYSKNHMKEITRLVKEFDESITLSTFPLYEKFGIENGEQILSEYFLKIERYDYFDKLVVTKTKPIVDYILSCHGNQNEIISTRYEEFYEYIEDVLKKEGRIEITKEVCLFRAEFPI